jgi:hypothetical protein
VFLKLSSRRTAGMAANPITFADIEAFQRLTLTDLSAWEVDVICQLDDAVMSAWAGEVKKAKPKADAPAAIPVGDTKSMKAMFRGLAARKRLAAEQKQG